MQKINNNNKKKLIPILKSNSRKRERGKNVKVVLFWPLGHGKMILCSAAAHTSILTPRQSFFLIKSECEAFFVSFVSFYQQIFLTTFYLILLIIHSWYSYILAIAIIDMNCGNQLS